MFNLFFKLATLAAVFTIAIFLYIFLVKTNNAPEAIDPQNIESSLTNLKEHFLRPVLQKEEIEEAEFYEEEPDESLEDQKFQEHLKELFKKYEESVYPLEESQENSKNNEAKMQDITFLLDKYKKASENLK